MLEPKTKFWVAKALLLVKSKALARLYMFWDSNQNFKLPYYYRLDDTLIVFKPDFL